MIATVVAGFTYIYYHSPLRGKVEDQLFDWRTLLMPKANSHGEILLVSLDSLNGPDKPSSLPEIGGSDTNTKTDQPLPISSEYTSADDGDAGSAGFPRLYETIRVLLKYRPAAITVFLHSQIYSYDARQLTSLMNILAKHPEVFLATFATKDSRADVLAQKYPELIDQLAYGDLPRSFRREIIRSVPVQSAEVTLQPIVGILAQKLAPMAYLELLANSVQNTSIDRYLQFLASSATGNSRSFTEVASPGDISFKLNYLRPQDLKTVTYLEVQNWSAHHLNKGQNREQRNTYPGNAAPIGNESHRSIGVSSKVQTEGKNGPQPGAIIFVGHTDYLATSLWHREASRVNTPWQSEGGELSKGVPLLAVQAIGFANLYYDTWLRQGGILTNIVHTIIVACGAGLIWFYGTGLASFLLILGSFIMLYFHGLGFRFLSFYLPLADTFLVGSAAALLGGLWRLRTEGRARAVANAEAAAVHDLAAMQERFLSRFTDELNRINQTIGARLSRQSSLAKGGGRLAVVYQKALSGYRELEEYLGGIRAFGQLKQATGQTNLNLEILQPALLLADLMQQFEGRLEEQNLITQWHGDQELLAVADRHILKQILLNFATNAIKFSPRGGTITLRCGETQSGYGRNGHTTTGDRMMFLEVEDQGPGIKPGDLEHIFDKFNRVKNDSFAASKGHGLGLYLSKYFAALIGAKILASANPAGGARFRIILRMPKADG